MEKGLSERDAWAEVESTLRGQIPEELKIRTMHEIDFVMAWGGK